jgi:hypothetical protein
MRRMGGRLGSDGLTADDDVRAPACDCVQHRAVFLLVSFSCS